MTAAELRAESTDCDLLRAYLEMFCPGKPNARQEPRLARALGWSVRHLQSVAEELGNATGCVGTACGAISGLYWIETAEEAAEVERHFRRRALPMLRRRGAIRRHWLAREQLGLWAEAQA